MGRIIFRVKVGAPFLRAGLQPGQKIQVNITRPDQGEQAEMTISGIYALEIAARIFFFADPFRRRWEERCYPALWRCAGYLALFCASLAAFSRVL